MGVIPLFVIGQTWLDLAKAEAEFGRKWSILAKAEALVDSWTGDHVTRNQTL